MNTPSHLLLLAGAGEAREIAKTLAGQHSIKITASLHFPERAYGPMPVPTRIGRFGGEGAFATYLREESITAVLDATHSFATRISFRSAGFCAAANLPYAQVLRPEWQAGPDDTWIDVADEAAAADVIPPGARVFTATGRATLGGFRHMKAAHLFVRQLAEGGAEKKITNVSYIYGKAPFSVDEEISLFKNLQIDWLVVRNVGGEASRSKLDAARALGLPVAMIHRPEQPVGLKLQTAQQALDWVDGL